MTQESTTSPDRHLVATYVSDVVALLKHIDAPVESQIQGVDAAKYADAIGTLQNVKSVTTAQLTAFEAHLKTLGGPGDHAVKSAFASLLGAGAAAVNHVRATKISKSLRDDYTALALAAISFTMLHATALGLGDETTGALAKRGLDAVAPLIVHISRVIPSVVLQELRDDGEDVRVSAAQITQEETARSWSGSAKAN